MQPMPLYCTTLLGWQKFVHDFQTCYLSEFQCNKRLKLRRLQPVTPGSIVADRRGKIVHANVTH